MMTQEERRRQNPALDALLRDFEAKKDRLLRFFSSGVFGVDDIEVARSFASERGGVLSDLWLDFLSLPLDVQLIALSQDDFRGMHWQSLVQSSPVVVTQCWRNFK